MATLARWCFRHRLVVILIWLAGFAGLSVASSTAGNAYSDSFAASGADSTVARDLLSTAFPSQAGDVDTIVWRVDSGTAADPAVRSRIEPMLAEVSKLPHVAAVTSPYTADGAAQVSADRQLAFASVHFDQPAEDLPLETLTDLVDKAKATTGNGLDVELGGRGIQRTEAPLPSLPTVVGIVAAGIVLFLAFGSLFAMLLPLITAILALGTATGAIGLLSHAMGVSTTATTLAALIGLGIGVDYALFVVTRHRNGLKAGLDPEESAVVAINTAGRAVVFAGIAVCVALLGLLLLGVDLIDGLAIPSALTVLLTVAAAVTLLPAMLGVFGRRILSRRERRRMADGVVEPTAPSGFGRRWAELVRRRPALLTLGVVVLVGVLAAPFFSMRLGASDQGNNPSSWSSRKAYDMLADGFGPGFNGPLLIAVRTPGGAADDTTVAALRDRIGATGGVVTVGPAQASQDRSVTTIQVIPSSGPQEQATSDLIDNLREDVIPAAVRGSAVTAYVTGVTAVFDDFASVLADRFPLFLLVIIALGALLLMVAFRSFVIPLMSAAMNLVAVGITFGVLTAAFQWGWLENVFGFGGTGPIDPSLPVLCIAVLFGLSMDYQVFLVSRIHEEWTRTRDHRQAIMVGQYSTSRVITVAAFVMILVFVSFAAIGERIISEFGISLAVAVLFDAFVLRSVLVPALMHMTGKATWWIPRWLDRILPRVSIEASDVDPKPIPAAEPVPAAAP
ncbi:MMPL family transporter [Actinoplanes sp. NPDC026619]|uniref:MMPL family transporter n=1 Tax=Actinoplanes sp. NPDC026619 TaxID=3155798 RepID=UPI0033CA3DFB